MQKFFSVLSTLKTICQQEGVYQTCVYFSRRVRYYLFFSVKFLLVFPIVGVILLIRPFKKIYFIMLLSSRIGHFSANTEFMILDQLDTLYEKRKLYLFYEDKFSSNIQLSKMWRRLLIVLPFPRICREVDRALGVILGEKYRHDPVKAFESCLLGRDHKKWLEKRHFPHLYFTPREIYEAEERMQKFGFSPQNPFVCILVRDAGYLDHRAPGKNLFSYHNVRDADINNYCKSALFLAEKNYTVFRMGKHVEKKFDIVHPNIIDYANHPMQCDLLDIYLASHCQFMISTSTGLDCISQIFKKPVLFTNLLPIYRQLQFWYPCLLYIPKKIRCRDTKRIFNFQEIAAAFSDVIDHNMQERLDEKNAEIVANTDQEILDVVMEMEARVNKTWVETEEDRYLQHALLNHSKASTIYYEEFSSSDYVHVKMGSQFIKNNKNLLGPLEEMLLPESAC